MNNTFQFPELETQDIKSQINNKKVVCLGKEFNSEEERREYFRNELRTKLPELKKIEGFPIGEDEDILALSDPPYYTACPNPWLNDFISEWEKEKESIPGRVDDFQVEEPYANDVSVGKNNPIYNAHSYHTKVPHPAIMRYILHYTQPGDIVFDGFAGTGMTGVAAQLCANPDSENKFTIEQEFKDSGLEIPQWGKRQAICGDLSPIASFIAYNYNTPIKIADFVEESKRILSEIEKKCGWMYETKDQYGMGKINFTVWSDVFICPSCSGEIVFWEAAVDEESGQINDEFPCTHCGSMQTKRSLSKAKHTIFDKVLNRTIQQIKTVPVLINYNRNGKRYEKKPDADDLVLLKKIEEFEVNYWFPFDRMPEGEESRRNDAIGYTHVHHFYSNRSLYLLSFIKSLSDKSLLSKEIWFLFEQWVIGFSHLNRYSPTHYSQNNRNLAGTLYIGSQQSEVSFYYAFGKKILTLVKAFSLIKRKNPVYVGSANAVNIKDDMVDYIFTDPPFGANLMYSELNFLWESWIKIKTNNKSEAIQNKSQGKTLLEYQNLMLQCFQEYFRILKPGKWMTVEFSNTSAAVWNGIQTAIQRAGFIIANVAALDKQQGSFKAVTTPTAVKQDLIISCYKPSTAFEINFHTGQSEVGIWDFITEHFNHLPVHIKKDNNTTAIVERSPNILFDRLITFYFMRGLVPINAKEFQEGLKLRFVERNGMYFTAEQAAEYDEKKAKAPQFVQYSLIVTNESDAIEWLKDRLRDEPQKYQDVMPDFRMATQSLRKGDTLPELQDILNESFIQEPDGKWRVPDINEAQDREDLRTKVLLKEFNGYITTINQPKTKKLKEVRVEALRAGFKNCWEQKDFKTIVVVGDLIPQNILLEDEKLLMYYDIAKDRI